MGIKEFPTFKNQFSFGSIKKLQAFKFNAL